MPAVYLSCVRERARLRLLRRECKCSKAPRMRAPVREGARGYPERIKGRAETRLKNHDPCVRTIHPSLSLQALSALCSFCRSRRFARGFKSASTHPKQPDFLLRAPVCGDDILFRACYANRELSSAGERPRDERRVSTLGGLRKITVIDFAKTAYRSRLCDSISAPDIGALTTFFKRGGTM